MVCCPVGNQIKYSKRKADMALSGYCTAPDAAIDYFRDTQWDNTVECRHSFDTDPMERGIRLLLGSLGFQNPERVFASARNPDDYREPLMLFTQMLCMISPDGRSEAKEVDKLLRTKPDIFLCQANASLTSWYQRLKSCLKSDGELMLMGDQAWKLLLSSRVTEYAGPDCAV
ncbi:hypothetical protein C4561_04620 [candidate division WWE3 bacterium]|uniref:Uncharacterized protein n=1 Tax=candidate division WWE3 bacterium TaxID=2053526 RepID=A0A3A4ZBK5_UNCKA|nr:MAG: hypothetical protein C4561_04620 [candidate division WWE3 bacterium]